MAVDPNNIPDPLGNESGTGKRQKELDNIRFAAASAGKEMETLSKEFENLNKAKLAAQNFDLGLDKFQSLTSKIEGLNVNTLKSAKERKAFATSILKAEQEQNANLAKIRTLNEDISDRVAEKTENESVLNDLQNEIRDKAAAALIEQTSLEQKAIEARQAGHEADAIAAEQEASRIKSAAAAEAARDQQRINNAQDLVKETEREISALNGQKNTAIEIVNVQTQQIGKAKQVAGEMERIENATPGFIEAFAKFGEIAAAIPIIGPIFNQITGDISKAADMFKKLKAEGKSSLEAIKKAGSGFIKLGLAAAATAFVSAAVKGFTRSSEVLVKLNKSVAGSMVNMSAQAGRVAAAAGKYTVPLTEAAATIAGINESLGTSLDFTQETTDQAIKLANKYGVSIDAVAHIVKNSAANKKTMTETVDAVTAGVARFNEMNNVSISTKAIFEDIGKASATTLRGIGKQPGALAAAAAAARSLGMSMEDIRSASESTTDFQKSLTDEMTTEMMLGKQLNLNKLREAALTGDVTTQAEEMKRLVMENQGRIGNNVKLQEQFAATLGISRDQYNDMLKTQDAMSVLTGKSGAAEKANDKARKMTQGEIAAQIESTTGKLTTLADKISKFQEDVSSGAANFAKDIIDGFEGENTFKKITNGLTNAFNVSVKALEDGIKTIFSGDFSGSALGKMLGVLTGGFILVKAGKGIFKLIKSIGSFVGLGKNGGFFSGSKDTYTADGRLRVDGGGLGDMGQQTDADMSTSSLGNSLFKGNLFKYLGNKGGLSRTLNRGFIKMFGKARFTKFLQTKVFNVLGKNTTMLGRAMNNFFAKVIPNSAKNLTKAFGTNNMSKILNQARGGNVKALSKVKKFVKPQFLKSALSKGMDPKVANTLLKSTTNLSKGARVMSSLGKIFTKGNIAAIAGGIIVDKIASYSKEKADKSLTDAANIETNNTIGFNDNISDLSDKIGLLNQSAKSRGIEKAAGVGSAALTGAGIGSMVGSIIPGIGNAIGGAVGGVIGAGVGLYQQYFSKEAKENAQLEREARAEMLGITIEEEKLLRKKGVEEAVNLRLEEAAQAKEAASEMLQMDLASFAQMTAEERNRHINKLNLSDQMMEELNTNLGTATADLSKVINEEAQKIEDNSFVGKTKKFFSNLFGGGDEKNVTKIEQKIDSAPIIRAASSDAQKIRNSVGSSEKTIAAAVAASEVRAQNIANTQKEQQTRDQNSQMRELQNQTALLFEYVAKPTKSIIKMNTFKVGQSLTRV